MAGGRLLLIIAIVGVLMILVRNCQARDGTCDLPSITRVNFQNYIEILNGTNRTLSCEIHSDTALKEPIWRKDSSRLSTDSNYIVENASCSNSTNHTCIVSNLTLINAVRFEYKDLDKVHYVGNYSLTAENDCGTSVVYVYVDIYIPPICEVDYNKPPQLKIAPPSVVEAVEGHSVTITAQYEGNEDDRNLGIYWCVFKTQDDYYCYNLTEDDNYIVSTDGCPPGHENCCYFTVLLKIKSVTRNLTLQSMVVWYQDPQNFIPGNSSLVANVYPTLDKRIPDINNQLLCVELTEGQSTEFTCIYNASTDPNVTIATWEFNEELLEHDSSHYTMTTQYGSDPVNVNHVLSRITLTNVKHDNAGTYTCQCVYNPKVIVDDQAVVSEAASFCLKVKGLPWWLYVSVIVAVIIVISISVTVLLILYCCWRRRKKKKRDQTFEADDVDEISEADDVDENTQLLSNRMTNVVAAINNQNKLRRSRREKSIKSNIHSDNSTTAVGTDSEQPSSKPLLNLHSPHQLESESDGVRSNTSEKSTKFNKHSDNAATAAVTTVGTGTVTVTITTGNNDIISAIATAEPEGMSDQSSTSQNGHSTTKSSESKTDSEQSLSKPLLNRPPSHQLESESDGGGLTANTSDDASSTDKNQDKLISGQDAHSSTATNHQTSHHQHSDMVTGANVTGEVHDQLAIHSTSLESFKGPSRNPHLDQLVISKRTKKPVIPVLPTEKPIECETEAPRISHPAAVRPPEDEPIVPQRSNQAKNDVPSITEPSTGCHNRVFNLIAPEFTYVNMVSLLPYLQQHQLVTRDQEHHLSIEVHSPVKKAELLLSYLKAKGDGSLQKILCCLNLADEHTGHKDIADKLKQIMEANNIKCANFCADHCK